MPHHCCTNALLEPLAQVNSNVDGQTDEPTDDG